MEYGQICDIEVHGDNGGTSKSELADLHPISRFNGFETALDVSSTL